MLRLVALGSAQSPENTPANAPCSSCSLAGNDLIHPLAAVSDADLSFSLLAHPINCSGPTRSCISATQPCPIEVVRPPSRSELQLAADELVQSLSFLASLGGLELLAGSSSSLHVLPSLTLPRRLTGEHPRRLLRTPAAFEVRLGREFAASFSCDLADLPFPVQATTPSTLNGANHLEKDANSFGNGRDLYLMDRGRPFQSCPTLLHSYPTPPRHSTAMVRNVVILGGSYAGTQASGRPRNALLTLLALQVLVPQISWRRLFPALIGSSSSTGRGALVLSSPSSCFPLTCPSSPGSHFNRESLSPSDRPRLARGLLRRVVGLGTLEQTSNAPA